MKNYLAAAAAVLAFFGTFAADIILRERAALECARASDATDDSIAQCYARAGLRVPQ